MAAADHLRMMNSVPPDAPKVAMLVYPQMVALDLVGPLSVFKVARFDTMLVGKRSEAVPTAEGLPIAATHTFEDCPRELDVLFVPGGIMGTIAAMNDPQVMAFLADRGARARWVTSVCTGSLALAAAGLLNGYDATSYWAVADLLPLMGARHVDQRVVTDRNRMTGGGVTAGLDFALTLVAAMKGEALARRAALTLEYAPQPPFASGTPAQAGPALTAALRDSRQWMDGEARVATLAARERLGLAVR
ncbi:DJ-1/PfpI family protein [Burkholderia gladioli]|nr:DJ-1/PfpI family protein [Burkholderia gladioli]MBW5285057.1 DJ-1/PfpI family protein [Burkholderia gladioli]